jgi:hypothetical protein
LRRKERLKMPGDFIYCCSKCLQRKIHQDCCFHGKDSEICPAYTEQCKNLTSNILPPEEYSIAKESLKRAESKKI